MSVEMYLRPRGVMVDGVLIQCLYVICRTLSAFLLSVCTYVLCGLWLHALGIIGVSLVSGVELILGGGVYAGGIGCGLCCVVRLLCICILLISSFCLDYGVG